jgi:hypothetical protein
MFDKKDKKKLEKEQDEVKYDNLEKMVDSGKFFYPPECNSIIESIRVLREALKSGQIRHKKYTQSLNDVTFSFVMTTEQAVERGNRISNPYGYDVSRIHYCNSMDDLILVNKETVLKEKKENLETQLKKAQEEQKKKVEEIEKLAKELGELE